MIASLLNHDPKDKTKVTTFYVVGGLIIILTLALLWIFRANFSSRGVEAARSDDNTPSIQPAEAEQSASPEKPAVQLATYEDPAGRFSFQYDPANADLQPEKLIQEINLDKLPVEPESPDAYGRDFLLQERSALGNLDEVALKQLYGVTAGVSTQILLSVREHTDGAGMLFKRYMGEDPAYVFSYVFYAGNSRIALTKQISLLDGKYISAVEREVYRVGSLTQRLVAWQKLVTADDGATKALITLQADFNALVNTLRQK